MVNAGRYLEYSRGYVKDVRWDTLGRDLVLAPLFAFVGGVIGTILGLSDFVAGVADPIEQMVTWVYMELFAIPVAVRNMDVSSAEFVPFGVAAVFVGLAVVLATLYAYRLVVNYVR